jgi:hypothetical protein
MVLAHSPELSKEFMKDFIEVILPDDIRRMYGGCNPFEDNPCVLRIRMYLGYIQVFCDRKWSPLVPYKGRVKHPKYLYLRNKLKEVIVQHWDVFTTVNLKFKWEDYQPPTEYKEAESYDYERR